MMVTEQVDDENWKAVRTGRQPMWHKKGHFMAPVLLLPLASSFTHHRVVWILYRAETGLSYKLSLACFGIHRALGNSAVHTNCLSYAVGSKDSFMLLVFEVEQNSDGVEEMLKTS